MEKRRLVMAIVVVAVCAITSVAVALPPMGPPMATLKQGQWGAGAEYAYSKMDLKGDGKGNLWLDGAFYATEKGTLHVKDLKSNWLFGNIGYGIKEDWEAFLRLGIADAEDEIQMSAAEMHEAGFSADYGFAWGFGTKATFFRQGEVTWGGLFQMTWANPDDGKFSYTDTSDVPPVPISGDMQADWWEMQIAVGPTWHKDGFCLYGGGFLYFVDGDLNAKGTGSYTDEGGPHTVAVKITSDLEEDSEFGGYVGAQWDLSKWVKNASWSAEFQLTGDAWAFGTGVIWRLP
jgi:hypothetical protein